MKILSRTFWGAGHKTLLTLYGTIIRSALDYGMPAYYFAPKCHLEKLQTIQNQALRICCGAMQSTPICALQASCNELPPHLRHYYLCLSFKAKLSRLPPNSHPARSLIEDSEVEVYGFTEKIISTFNLLTKSPVFCGITIEPQPLSQKIPWLLPRARVDVELTQYISKSDTPELTGNTSLD